MWWAGKPPRIILSILSYRELWRGTQLPPLENLAISDSSQSRRLMLVAASLVSAWQAPVSLRGVSSPLRSASLVRMDVTGEYLASTEDASLEVGAPMLTPPPAATATSWRHCPAAVSATRLTCGAPSTGGVRERQGDRAGRTGDGAGRDGASAAEEA
eukprot:scaffold1229_cov60-Phaeocystis_antarctica.AAC.6